MCQVLDDFLGILCLARSRFSPTKKVKEVLRGDVSIALASVPLLPTILSFCWVPTREPTPTGRKRDSKILESSLSLFPMVLQGSDNTFTACPGHLAAFTAKCFRNQWEAAVDFRVKGTYVSSFKTSLGGVVYAIKSLGGRVYLFPC
jgi:hypothetical protein